MVFKIHRGLAQIYKTGIKSQPPLLVHHWLLIYRKLMLDSFAACLFLHRITSGIMYMWWIQFSWKKVAIKVCICKPEDGESEVNCKKRWVIYRCSIIHCVSLNRINNLLYKITLKTCLHSILYYAQWWTANLRTAEGKARTLCSLSAVCVCVSERDRER